jgi:hypothetical protein
VICVDNEWGKELKNERFRDLTLCIPFHKEALAAIKAFAKKEQILAAEGAIRFLEKLSPAF